MVKYARANFAGKSVPRFFLLVLCATMLAGCGSFQLPSRADFSAEWVPPEGKSRDQFREDQLDCRRDTVVISSPGFSSPGAGMGGGGNWGMAERKSFENCMRSKGWIKK